MPPSVPLKMPTDLSPFSCTKEVCLTSGFQKFASAFSKAECRLGQFQEGLGCNCDGSVYLKCHSLESYLLKKNILDGVLSEFERNSYLNCGKFAAWNTYYVPPALGSTEDSSLTV